MVFYLIPGGRALLQRGGRALRPCLVLLVAACGTAAPLPTQSPAERASLAREAWRRAAAAQRAGLPDSVWADVKRAHRAWPAQPAYAEAVVRLAARRGDDAALEDALQLLAAQEAGGGVALDTAVRAAALRTAAGAAAFAELQQRVAPDERSRPRVLSSDSTFFPEGLDVDPRTGTLYITSLRHRMVYGVAPEGAMTPVLRVGPDDIAAPFGVAFDATRDVLWVTTAGVVHMAGYQPTDSARAELLRVRRSDGAITARWTLGVGTGTPGELALTPSGEVLVSDAALGRMYRLRADTGSMETIDHSQLRSPQGIAVDARGRVAWVADWSHGLLRWDLQTDSISAVETPDHVTLLGIDGLRRAGDRLIGVQNGIAPARIVEITLDATGAKVRAVRTLNRPSRLEGEMTVGAADGDRYVYIASSAWPFWTEDGERRANTGPLPSVTVRELPVVR
jgi:hypothetical protein